MYVGQKKEVQTIISRTMDIGHLLIYLKVVGMYSKSYARKTPFASNAPGDSIAFFS